MSTSSTQPQTRTPTGTAAARLWRTLTPPTVTVWVRGTALASVLANLLLVITGGLVRLTQSGLGCPTWPRCTDDSWSNVPEMGIHGFIEFGNRTLTGVLGIVAVLTVLAVMRLRTEYRDLFWLAILLFAGIPVQAVVGGLSVWLRLNPWMVGVHFVLSAVMIALAGVLWSHTRRYSLPRVREAERLAHLEEADPTMGRLGAALLVLTAAAVYLGTLVTGTGPHSGDATSARHAFDAVTVTRMHSVSVWLTVLTVALGLTLCVRRGWAPGVRAGLLRMVAVLVLQGGIGYLQYFNGLPIWMVELHLLGAGLTVWAAAAAYDRMAVLAQPTRRETALVHTVTAPERRAAQEIAGTEA
ncbi:COX15/CtaA family protein [Rothia kristinae]|uniref:COX15/CtaA family protein n=1 Tax=Rothia kristinae TaxID=37923 RepID=UPI001E2BC361|nr:COX15/CtaA family protein [Rothia kristinae]